MSTKTQDKAEKILRIGVIHGGKIVEERLLKKREVVTVGSDPKNTFVLPGADIPRSVKLFDVKGSVYTLCFTEQMDGKLNVGEAAVDFAGLKSQNLATKQGDSYRVNLNDDSKGKVQVGDVPLLFQFVVPPPVAPATIALAGAEIRVSADCSAAPSSSAAPRLRLVRVGRRRRGMGAGLGPAQFAPTIGWMQRLAPLSCRVTLISRCSGPGAPLGMAPLPALTAIWGQAASPIDSRSRSPFSSVASSGCITTRRARIARQSSPRKRATPVQSCSTSPPALSRERARQRSKPG